jgi:hypothetical protein
MTRTERAALSFALAFGIMLATYGVLGMIAPVQQVADLLQRGPVQVVTVDP